MNYVYDILVNFKYPLLDFYEWNPNDNIENIKRIPFYKVSTKDLNIFKYNKIKIKDMNPIKNGTKLFNNKKKVYNSSIYTDGNEAIVLNFDDNGICIGKSSLLIDEENEILDSSHLLLTSDIEYSILNKDKINEYKTRKQVTITNFLIREIKKINNIDKLNYICYECFDDNLEKDEIINKISNNWNDKYYKIYDFLTSISMNKK
ncbi:MAG: hypothetical protein IJ565_04685 [Bacilli bacterium]|nr:hypothetical protein [Bacilli bacterium]